MAKTTATRRASVAREAPKKAPDFIALKVVADTTEEAPTYYMNFAEVALSEHEFCLIGLKVPTKFPPSMADRAKASGNLSLRPEFQIIFPPTLIDGLISALTTTKQNYEKRFHRSLSKPSAGKNGGTP